MNLLHYNQENRSLSLHPSTDEDLHRRAPTLMAAAEAGSRGTVSVWGPRTLPSAPDEKGLSQATRVFLGIGMIGAVPTTFLLLSSILLGSLKLFLLAVAIFAGSIVGLTALIMVATMRSANRKALAERPNYVSSDQAGICFGRASRSTDGGLTTSPLEGCATLAWDEIAGLETVGSGFSLHLLDGTILCSTLRGCSRQELRDLARTICIHSGLEKTHQVELTPERYSIVLESFASSLHKTKGSSKAKRRYAVVGLWIFRLWQRRFGSSYVRPDYQLKQLEGLEPIPPALHPAARQST